MEAVWRPYVKPTLISFEKTQVTAKDGVALLPSLFPHSCTRSSIVALNTHFNIEYFIFSLKNQNDITQRLK